MDAVIYGYLSPQGCPASGASYTGTFFACILCVDVTNAFTSALERRYGKSK